jgi:transcriptional regulator with AAA-type ATPase domain
MRKADQSVCKPYKCRAETNLAERPLLGRSASIQRLRRQILDFAANPVARAVLLRGPIGVGKKRTCHRHANA